MPRAVLTVNRLCFSLVFLGSGCTAGTSDEPVESQSASEMGVGSGMQDAPAAGGAAADPSGGEPSPETGGMPVEPEPPPAVPPPPQDEPPMAEPQDEPPMDEPQDEPPGSDDPVPPPSSDLDPAAPPSTNFDLSAWYISLPREKDGKVLNVFEEELNAGFEDPDFFFTGEDGGMVFKSPTKGPKTSGNTQYTRSEFREMLRRGDTDIKTKGVNPNNWVFSTAPESDRDNAGGVDGVLRATLAVNHVTTNGTRKKVGRVVVGQIHANDDEPLRIYYQKYPENEFGSIYFAHEPRDGDERWISLIGNEREDDSNPSDGIALNERFSYEVVVSGNDLSVTVTRDDGEAATEQVDMEDSGFDEAGQYMYFKAGVYNQNDTGDDDGYVQATFYSLETSHD